MYNRINLSQLLLSLGYLNPQVQKYNASMIPYWYQVCFAVGEQGNEYKPGSLYLEVKK